MSDEAPTKEARLYQAGMAYLANLAAEIQTFGSNFNFYNPSVARQRLDSLKASLAITAEGIAAFDHLLKPEEPATPVKQEKPKHEQDDILKQLGLKD
jgi:hypothetical protein